MALRFNASMWCNIAVALRNIEGHYAVAAEKVGMNVLEWYIIRALLAQDGQQASELARAVGRAPTSFTPILDKLQARGLIERRPHGVDRRALSIHLTPTSEALRAQIEAEAQDVEVKITQHLNATQLPAFHEVLVSLQNMPQA
jgi:DNA-binding MarR family transcriptional regulator